jgi:MFS family permease
VTPFPALRHRNFTLLWLGLFVSNTGTWMQNVAQGWVVYKATGDDPLWLGWLGLAFAAPMVVLPPLGGVVADRFDRVRIVVFTQTCAMLLALVLAALSWMHWLRPIHLVASTFVGAVLLAFDNPARQTLIPELVPREHLQNALSLSAATFTGAALLGPAISGALLDVVSVGWLFLSNALSFLAVLGALFALRDVAPHAAQRSSLRDAFLGGIVWARRQPRVRALLVVAAVSAVGVRSYPQLLPIFAAQNFHAGARGYGALLSAGGAGALVGAFVMTTLRDVQEKGRVILFSGVALALVLMAFAVSPVLVVGLFFVLLAAVAATVLTTMIATTLQLDVPRELRGRVMSLHVTTLIGLPALGAFFLAPIARAIGGRAAIVTGAASTLIVFAWLRAAVTRGQSGV